MSDELAHRLRHLSRQLRRRRRRQKRRTDPRDAAALAGIHRRIAAILAFRNRG